ncbi:NADP-dependent oxidoreductase [Glutamicibacter sp.]|uniref:NADP-dependent oxidoreductase n=1 Tax=Glutamicibacter sp. TaxID=1931995 RepID=UPI002B46AD9D|nr:NADP-dependent oxidoreductase [Glutamicibacter sp.]HJX79010.1 NADP-dependent oxidoreductase [Glutamicibacter sp.]
MRAFIFNKYNGHLHEVDVPEPSVGDQDVLIEVAASSVNQLDEKIRLGEFKAILPYKLPLVLGHDVAGTVISVGAKVKDFAHGDRVFARPRDHRIGTFAQRIAVDQADVALAPRRVEAMQAASLPLVALTAWQALVERGNLRPGQKVLIHAGAGGVGTIAIQLAKHLGAHVVTTASAKNAEFLKELGADQIIDYRTEDFAAQLSNIDLVLDSLGGEILAKSLTVLKPGGKAIGITGPPTPAFAAERGLGPVVGLVTRVLSYKVRKQAKRLGVQFEFLFMKSSGSQLRQIAGLVDSGVIKPVVGKSFTFDRAPEALDALSAGGHRGKIVIAVK